MSFPRPLIAAVLAASLLAACSTAGTNRSGDGGAKDGGGPGPIRVVAAENTWGSIAAGLGGDRVQVRSIIANPSIDPHDYEASVADARAVAGAQLVVMNGGGYDAWMGRLLASREGNARVVNAAAVLPNAAAANLHLFADPGAVEVVSRRITAALVATDPDHADYYEARAAAQRRDHERWVGQLRAIAAARVGTMAAATENLALPVLRRAGLRVLTPTAFMRAVAQGVDPAPRDLEAARAALDRGVAKLLASNLQAATPVTEQMVGTARARGIPVVEVFEVLPAGRSYYQAMAREAEAIAAALGVALP